jgi:MFS superfamily sulfate permease-like transporter
LPWWLGLLDLALGVLRLGFLVNFLSRSVISGFMAGAAVIIAPQPGKTPAGAIHP